jgi:hypothetical protein
MAQKRDIAAEKARKQKIILAVAGVLLVGVAGLQVPKLMKGSSQPAAAPAATAAPVDAATAPTTGATGATGATGTVTPTSSVTKPAAFVAGVALPGTQVAPPEKSQLASFTLFEPGDPFVQQVGDASAGAATEGVNVQQGSDQPATDVPAASSGGSAPDTGSAGSGGGSSPTAPVKPAAIAFATINFDGKPQQLEVKQKFPKNDPMFVLVSLKKKQAKIGVAGGTFDDGATVTLTFGKKLTLANTATGVRYELKLVYTGSQPEVIESFSTAGKAAGTDQQGTTASAGSSSTAAAASGLTP